MFFLNLANPTLVKLDVKLELIPPIIVAIHVDEKFIYYALENDVYRIKIDNNT